MGKARRSRIGRRKRKYEGRRRKILKENKERKKREI
jgi:hypothetical protein